MAAFTGGNAPSYSPSKRVGINCSENAAAWGMDFEKAEKGWLKVVNRFPYALPMEDHHVRMRDTIADYKPQRLAVDSLSALERVFSLRSDREFVIGLTS